MKHRPVILSRGTLINHIPPEYGIDDDDLLECKGPDDEIWIVEWPEHVICPKFNSDAVFRGPFQSILNAKNESPNAIIHLDDLDR